MRTVTRAMASIVGSHDLLFVTLDTLRHDVAVELAAADRIPHLVRAMGGAVDNGTGGSWERRHTPASFTYAAHHAFFAGFLPTPVGPGPHDRLFAAAFPGSETTGPGTWTFTEPDLVSGLASAGYHTVCVGGVGFFNQRSALGRVLPSLFAESHWEPSFGVTNPSSVEAQVDRAAAVVAALPADRRLFLFLNVSALHQPNRYYLPGAAEDCRASHAAALAYVDSHLGRLFATMTSRGRPCFAIVCSDHGTAYGEDGLTGHRIAHETVWTVPYADFVLHPGDWTA